MKLYMHPVALLFSQFSDDVNPTLADHQPTVGLVLSFNNGPIQRPQSPQSLRRGP